MKKKYNGSKKKKITLFISLVLYFLAFGGISFILLSRSLVKDGNNQSQTESQSNSSESDNEQNAINNSSNTDNTDDNKTAEQPKQSSKDSGNNSSSQQNTQSTSNPDKQSNNNPKKDKEEEDDKPPCNEIAAYLFERVVSDYADIYKNYNNAAEEWARKQAVSAGGGEGWVNAYKKQWLDEHWSQLQAEQRTSLQAGYNTAEQYGCANEFLNYRQSHEGELQN